MFCSLLLGTLSLFFYDSLAARLEPSTMEALGYPGQSPSAVCCATDDEYRRVPFKLNDSRRAELTNQRSLLNSASRTQTG
jgi:hypothetical protein